MCEHVSNHRRKELFCGIHRSNKNDYPYNDLEIWTGDCPGWTVFFFIITFVFAGLLVLYDPNLFDVAEFLECLANILFGIWFVANDEQSGHWWVVNFAVISITLWVGRSISMARHTHRKFYGFIGLLWFGKTKNLDAKSPVFRKIGEKSCYNTKVFTRMLQKAKKKNWFEWKVAKKEWQKKYRSGEKEKSCFLTIRWYTYDADDIIFGDSPRAARHRSAKPDNAVFIFQ